MFNNLDEQTRDFIRTRVRNMLGQKRRVDEKYILYNDFELEYFNKITASMTEEERDLMEDYRNAVIDRETQALYFTYLYGLKDGMTFRKEIEQYEE